MAGLVDRARTRRDEGCYVIEGPTLVAGALAAGVALVDIYAEDPPGARLAAAAADRGVPVHLVAPGALARVLSTVTPQPVAAVATLPRSTVEDVIGDGLPPLLLVLVGVADPGNAGTLLRSAEAAGAGAVVFCDNSVDAFSPKCVRASAGAVFHVAVVNGGHSMSTLETLAAEGVTRIATSPHGGETYDRVDLRGPIALVLGSEAHGLAPAVRARVDTEVRIPMTGRAESLNVAMAGTVLCFEAARQRRGTEGGT